MAKKLSDLELVQEFETACFKLTNYPNNKSINKTFDRLEKMLCERLGISEDQRKTIQN